MHCAKRMNGSETVMHPSHSHSFEKLIIALKSWFSVTWFNVSVGRIHLYSLILSRLSHSERFSTTIVSPKRFFIVIVLLPAFGTLWKLKLVLIFFLSYNWRHSTHCLYEYRSFLYGLERIPCCNGSIIFISFSFPSFIYHFRNNISVTQLISIALNKVQHVCKQCLAKPSGSHIG